MPNFFYNKAEENIELAALCASNGYYNGWANRIYYTIFQLIHAYLKLDKNISHEDLRRNIGMFRQDFNSKDEQLIEQLFYIRVDADYKNVEIDKKKYERYNLLALNLYNKIKNKIQV